MPSIEISNNAPSTPQSADEVCIIEADTGVGELLVELLENQFQVRSFSTFKEFEASFFGKKTTMKPDLILCDAKLRDATGIEALKRVRMKDRSVPFILLVNQPESKWTDEAFRSGVTDLVEKPFESFVFIDKFRGRIAQSKLALSQTKLSELLHTQLLLTTTHANRLGDKLTLPVSKRLAYADPDEDGVRFSHARKSEEKLLAELNSCRIEYLALARSLGIF